MADILRDFSIGWHPSALTLLLDSIAYTKHTGHVHRGYRLQAIGALLRASKGLGFPPATATSKVDLIEIGLAAISRLRAGAYKPDNTAPGFGQGKPRDAFGDGSENPADARYAWQSGTVMLGVAEFLHAVDNDESLTVTRPERLSKARDFLAELVNYWTPFYTSVPGAKGGYFWYSDQPHDKNIAVHNTTAQIAMAWWYYGDMLSKAEGKSYKDRAQECAVFLFSKTADTELGGLTWNYLESDRFAPRPEDIGHSLTTNQFIAFAGRRKWWSPNAMTRQGVTLLGQMWSGHPAELHLRVDGSDFPRKTATDRRHKTPQASVGYAAHANAPGGQPAAFDYARSILLSSSLSRKDQMAVPLSTPQALAVARMFKHRPAAFTGDKTWTVNAGPGDDKKPKVPGGVRFHKHQKEWEKPEQATFAGVKLVARKAKPKVGPDGLPHIPNIFINLEDNKPRPVVVSLVYASANDGAVEQWDGARYTRVAKLWPSSVPGKPTSWMRVSFLLALHRFDYNQGKPEPFPGINILLQITAENISIAQIEATVLG